MKKTVAIIGGGPTALAAASFLDADKFEVTIYEKNKSLGRKFLVAGKGGFNLTHAEPINEMISRYSDHPSLQTALSAFTNSDLRAWLASIGIPTYVGSSNRIYPEKGIKPIEVLNAIFDQLEKRSVRIKTQQNWIGWNDQLEPLFDSGEAIQTDYALFSLGGGSWKVTGSDGSWLETFDKQGIKTIPFSAANCAYQIHWNPELIENIEGMPLKNIALSSNGKTIKGEAVITQFGLEGSAIYALTDEIQSQLIRDGKADLFLDMKPSFTLDKIVDKMNHSKLKTTDFLKKTLKLSKAQIQLLKSTLTKENFLSKTTLAQSIKEFHLEVQSAAQIDEAISTTGGISAEEINAQFELKKIPGTFCMGEMLDWNAPTGGYLLQGCFSMGYFIASTLNNA